MIESNSMLSIEAYDRAEAAARARLSMREAQAFAPATFEDQNYPVRVQEEASLLRYVDTMHETFEGKFFDPSLFKYSRAEGELIGRVAGKVATMTKDRYAHSIRPWMSPFGAVPAFRVIRAFAERMGIEQPRVLELGPGSGYLGALCMEFGDAYTSMDNTQGFYLWQNRLMNLFAGDDFNELADVKDWGVHTEARAVHLAWWQWASMGTHPPLEADIVVCDHALGEMHPMALRHVLRSIRRILAGGGPRMFFFTAPGKEHYSDLNTIGRACIQSGLQLLTFGKFMAFTTPESSLSKYSIPAENAFKTRFKYRLRRMLSPIKSQLGLTPLAEFEERIPVWGLSPGESLEGAAEIVPVRGDEQPLDYSFLEAAGFRTPMDVVEGQASRAI